MAETILKFMTLASLFLVCGVINLWTHPRRVCWEHPKLAAVHIEGQDGYRDSVPKCSPLSYLLQPEFMQTEIEKVRSSLDLFSKTLRFASALDLPKTPKFNLIVSKEVEGQFSRRLFEKMLGGSNAPTRDAVAFFYSGLIENSAVKEDRFFEENVKFIENWSQEDQSLILGSLLRMLFDRLDPMDRPEFLQNLWRSKAHWSHEIEKLPFEKLVRSFALRSIDIVLQAPLKDSIKAAAMASGSHLEEMIFQKMSVEKVVQILGAEKEQIDWIQTLLDLSETKVVLFESPDERKLFPGRVLLGDSADPIRASELILLQCDPIRPAQTLEARFDKVYFIELCPGSNREFVAQKLISYLKASPFSEPRIDSTRYSLKASFQKAN